MFIKRLLIFLPLGLILLMAQSFYWVPTYDTQSVGNPQRLVKYIHSSIGDAQILNPALNADTSSADITGLVFDGLRLISPQPRIAKAGGPRGGENTLLA